MIQSGGKVSHRERGIADRITAVGHLPISFGLKKQQLFSEL